MKPNEFKDWWEKHQRRHTVFCDCNKEEIAQQAWEAAEKHTREQIKENIKKILKITENIK